jgi:hypothetical protein
MVEATVKKKRSQREFGTEVDLVFSVSGVWFRPNMKTLRRSLLATLVLGGLGAWLGLLWLERAHQEEPFSQIEDGLYLGSSGEREP